MPLNANEVRFIRLGEKNKWAAMSIERGELAFSYREVAHDICLSYNWEAVRERCLEVRRIASEDLSKPAPKAVATSDRNQIRAFYTLGQDCLWFTFHDGFLWWTFAYPEVHWNGSAGENEPPRVRKSVGGWSNQASDGSAVRINDLSSSLTKVQGFMGTICEVKAAKAYLLRRLNNEPNPYVIKANKARDAVVQSAAGMIRELDWSDFEIFVDLIFSRAGWQRVSTVGGSQKSIDMIMRLPVDEETAVIQVKSSITQAVVHAVAESLENYVCNRKYLAYHSATGTITAAGDLQLLGGNRLAELAVSAGLLDWLIEKSR